MLDDCGEHQRGAEPHPHNADFERLQLRHVRSLWPFSIAVR
jgi:hypothetical protein